MAADVFEAHLLECLLSSPQLVLVHLEADAILPKCVPLGLQVLPEDPQVVPQALLVCLEKADLLGVSLVALRLRLELQGLALKHFTVDG